MSEDGAKTDLTAMLGKLVNGGVPASDDVADLRGTTTLIQFRCRECGSTRMVESMKDVTVESECSIGDHGIEYQEQTNTDGEVVNYQCENGHIVKGADGEPITTEDELIQFLGDHPILSHEDAVALIAERYRLYLSLVDAETLVEEFNRHYPADELRSIGDSMYVRGNDDA